MPKKYKHITDEELDKLFKGAAENFKNSHPPEGAWDLFYLNNERKLKNPETEPLPEAAQKTGTLLLLSRKYRAAAAIFIILIGGIVFWMTGSNENNDRRPATVSQNPDIRSREIDPVQKDPISIENEVNLEPYVHVIRPDAYSVAIEKTASAKTDVGHEDITDVLLNAIKPHVVPSNKEVPDQNHHSGDKPVKTEKRRIDLAVENKAGQNNNYTATVFPAPSREPKKTGSSGKWQIGVVGGSNLAVVKGDVSSTPGLNTGILVQHRVNDSRLSLESGVIYESMTYAVENEYFNPGGKPVSSKVSNISGSCTMIDVPVNVRYDMVHSKKRKAFVSTGVSPTVMVKQSYVYDYTDESGTRLIDRDVTGQGKSFYAVANVSVGYEQKWNKTSVQVAPYLKIPMGEIGYGNLSLGGIGTQVSIKRDL